MENVETRRNRRKIQFNVINICDLYVHQFKCSGLTLKQFQTLSHPNSANWYCPICVNYLLPFPHLAKAKDSASHGSELSDKLNSLLKNLNNIVTDLTSPKDDEDELEIQFQSNSCSYLSCNELNSIVSKTPTTSVFHLNIACMSKHFSKLEDLLAQLKFHFTFIGITETRSLTAVKLLPLMNKNLTFLFQDMKNFSPLLNQMQVVCLYTSQKLSCIFLEMT